ncbi:hypothetical protein GGP66_000137 [Salinibacter ruber]|uniref:hypothetical protein n=1 Tax=Salinibacter ruber TaxID=146919 RepID=UPI002166E375|nr:hypothetical protein [Salinibacter ruber]MCS3672733.1 hypothetical protein [Salinibacter ruber]
MFSELHRRVDWGHITAMSLLLLVLSASPSAGQDQWRQTVQTIVPVKEKTIARALLDSVVSVVQNQDIPVQQAPQASSTSFKAIEDTLSEEGLAASSATHMFITYRFSLSSSTFNEKILDLYYIFRPEGQGGEDIPILYLDLREGRLYESLLIERGTRLTSNEATFLPFKQQVGFNDLRDQLAVVRVGNRTIRDTARAAAEKKRILEVIRNLTYN